MDKYNHAKQTNNAAIQFITSHGLKYDLINTLKERTNYD